MTTKLNTRDDLLLELEKPLNMAYVKQRRGGGTKELDYLEGHYVIRRMNELFGIGGWTQRTLNITQVGDKSFVATVEVTVPSLNWTASDVGANSNKTPEDAAKSAVTDGLKRVCRLLGNTFGLALYDAERKYVEVAAPLADIRAATTAEDLSEVYKVLVLPLRKYDEKVFNEAKAACTARKKELTNG